MQHCLMKLIQVQVRAKFQNMALILKRNPLVAFMLLELFEKGNDGFKRGKTKEWLRECDTIMLTCSMKWRSFGYIVIN